MRRCRFCCGRGGAACGNGALKVCLCVSRQVSLACSCGCGGGRCGGVRSSGRRIAGRPPTAITRGGSAICLTRGGIGGGFGISRCVSRRGGCRGVAPSRGLSGGATAGSGISSRPAVSVFVCGGCAGNGCRRVWRGRCAGFLAAKRCVSCKRRRAKVFVICSGGVVSAAVFSRGGRRGR